MNNWLMARSRTVIWPSMIWTVLVWFQIFLATNGERAVPARTDICSRFPSLSGCQTAAAAVNSPAQPSVTTPATTGATGSKSPAATAPPANPPTVSPEIQKLCEQYADLAQQYCVGPPHELPMAKEKCNYWRKYCQNLPKPTQSPLGGPPCAPYEVQYLTMCIQQQPVTYEIGLFCSGYRKACIYGKKANTLNTGFNAPVGRPLVPAASSTVVDPYPAPWSAIYTHEQRNTTLLQNGPIPPLPNMAPPWSSPPGLPGNLDRLPLGANPVNPALMPGFQGFAPGPAASVPSGGGTAPSQPASVPGSGSVPAIPQPSVPAVPSVPTNPGLGIGSGVGVGGIAGAAQNTQIGANGVSTGTGINAGGLPIGMGSGVGFGGLIPNVGVLGRRRRQVSVLELLKAKRLNFQNVQAWQ